MDVIVRPRLQRRWGSWMCGCVGVWCVVVVVVVVGGGVEGGSAPVASIELQHGRLEQAKQLFTLAVPLLH